MAYEALELRVGILELFAEANQRNIDRLGPSRLAARQGLHGRVRLLKPAEIKKPRSDGCPFCGSHAGPGHACAEFPREPVFAVSYRGPEDWARRARQKRGLGRRALSREEWAWRPAASPPADGHG